VDRIKIYSPNQVAFGSFVGGPLAAMFVLWSNFRALGNDLGARQTLIWGALFVLLLLIVLSFLPDRFPGQMGIPVAYTVAARSFAEKYQLSKSAIQESEQYAFQSNWNVFGISLATMVGSLIALFTVLFLWFFAIETIH
jgi:hypothetical protein